MNNIDEIEGNINLLLTKYDDTDIKSSKLTDTSLNGIYYRENKYLKEVIKSQKEIIDLFNIKFQDLSIQYNTKIEKLRETHLLELNDLHQQFRLRLKKEMNSNIK